MNSPYIQGFLLQAGLIIALGAQNVFVLECGLRKKSHVLVPSICLLCDLLLIFIAVSMLPKLLISYPLFKIILGIVGVIFLFVYGVSKLRTKVGQDHEISTHIFDKSDTKSLILMSLAFSLLNPHVYLDIFVLVGGFASRYLGYYERLSFGLGVATFSALWFFTLAIMAKRLGRYLKSPTAFNTVMRLSGAILIYLGIDLGLDIYFWIKSY